MSNTSEVDDSTFPAERAKFYELIGHCITQYQSLEDDLIDVFVSALEGPPRRARLMFEPYRGLEAKLSGITAAISNHDEEAIELWDRLRPLIRAASETRGKIAHASTLHHGGTHVVSVDEETGALNVRRSEKSRMELRKPEKNNELVWTNRGLFIEYEKILTAHGLLFDLITKLEGGRKSL